MGRHSTQSQPRFVCGYQGEIDYEWRGISYHVRTSADDYRPGVWNYTPEEYQAQRVALVGCIHGPEVGEFPPAELEQFHPGYVRARFNTQNWTVEYADSKRPETIHSGIYQGTMAKAWTEDLERYGVPVNRPEAAEGGAA